MLKNYKIYFAGVLRPIVLVTLTFALLSACSKDEQNSSSGKISSSGGGLSSSLFDSDALLALPPNSLGFFLLSTESPAYSNFRKSAWAQVAQTSVSEAIELLSKEPSAAAFLPYVSAVTKSKLIPIDPASEPAASGALLTVSGAQDKTTLNWSLSIIGRASEDLRTHLSGITAELKTGGVKLNPIQGKDEGQAFSISVGGDKSLFVLADSRRIAASTDLKEAERALSAVQSKELERLKGTSQWQSAVGKVSASNQIGVGFFDIAGLISANAPQIVTAIQTSGAAMIDEQKVKNIPFESVAFARTLDKTMKDQVVISLKPRDKDQQSFLNALSVAKDASVADIAPTESAFFLNINGESLVKFKTALIEHLPPAEAEAIPPTAALIDSIGSLGISLSSASSASPFPSLALLVRSTKAEELRTNLKQLVAMGLASQSAALGQAWMDKEVAGAKVSYLMTPFGVGVFLGAKGETLTIASSEDVLSSIFGGNGTGLAANLSDVTGSTPKVLLAFIDFQKIAAIIESLQGSMAMFTGGKPFIQPEASARLRRIGKVAFSVSGYNDNTISVETTSTPPTNVQGDTQAK